MPASSYRARVRAELTEEIKATARRHLAADGANLALRAVARDLGMVPSALYRYFASRDELLTALITDAYNALGEAVETAEAAVPRDELRGRWLAVCHAVRDWALVNPAEYTLLYGSPVPGYAAPADTVPPAARVVNALGRVLADSAADGVLPGFTVRPPAALREELRTLSAQQGPELPDAAAEVLLTAGIAAWVQLFGLVNFEVFGRFDDIFQARGELFDVQMRLMADLAGVPG
ncbi:TetR/AcrR family transcriptional regulator [Amycolatopsis nigrescens]|uniref:TetR/AcrR family transcriptional regulator n=1 Tax=Amycolatopsis nigrescens TaxID=381445 RepID=UPI0003814A01|nr:TetR/AcrR family transcriptional regulator [Amycolatopsis nigrescens]